MFQAVVRFLFGIFTLPRTLFLSCRDHEISERVNMGLGEIAKVGRSFQCQHHSVNNMLISSFSMVNQKENAHNILYCFLNLKNKIQIIQFSPKIKVIIMLSTCVHLNIFFESYLPSLELTQKSGLEDFEVASSLCL